MSLPAGFYGRQLGLGEDYSMENSSALHLSYPSHPYFGKALRTYQDLVPQLVQQVKEALREPMKQLQDEVAKFREELTEMRKAVDNSCQANSVDGGKNEGKKAKLPKVLTVS